MVSNDICRSTLEIPSRRKKTDIPQDKQQALENGNAVARPRKKTQKKQKPAPPIPAYELVPGKDYDVLGTHTSINGAEYTGYEIIGQLVLYCFLQGTQQYKFSEYAVRMGGWIRESDTGVMIPATPARKPKGR